VERLFRRGAERRARSVISALLLSAGVTAIHPLGATAHAIVLESVPAADAVLTQPPANAMLRFNSKIEKRLTRVTLTASGGTARPLPILNDDGAGSGEPDRVVVSLGSLTPGPYVLRYKVLSADGHVTEGALRFTVSARQ
jgi:methionine-rich copper-binding protein CopC